MKRTYGFIVTEEKWASCDAIIARVKAREGDDPHPINPRGEGEDEIWDAPKSAHGLALDGLEIIVHLSEGMHSSSCSFVIGPDVRYDTVRFVDEKLACRLHKTMQRINKQILKDDAHEAGDVVIAVAKALGLTWTATQTSVGAGWSYRDHDWQFNDVSKARNMFRACVAKFTARLNKVA
jgi:hypothetical protein